MEDAFLSIKWRRFPLEKLKISGLFKKVPIFYEVQSVIAVFVKAVIELYPKPDESMSKLHIPFSYNPL
jgi:hypothetical protein